MVKSSPPQDYDITIKFGGGVNSRSPIDEIDDDECVSGENFLLDVKRRSFKPRPPFSLAGTATNTSEIRGFAQLLASDGTITTLVQAGDTVYSWDGGSTFTSKGTVNSNAQLRGDPYNNYWALDDLILITDLNQQEVVKKWDGTTFANISTGLGSDFYAKYCFVSQERAWFGNVKAGTATPHMIVASATSDYTSLSISDLPSSALSTSDPFYLLAPDLRAVNGMVNAFGIPVFSTKYGNIYQILGSSAQDYQMQDLFPGSGSVGMESMIYTGDDVVYGRAGRIESLKMAIAQGDVQSNDLSLNIYPDIESIDNWLLIRDGLRKRIYCWPSGGGYLWSYQQGHPSPWSKWTTAHSFAYTTTCAMRLLDPSTGLDTIYAGDSSGNIYQFDADFGSGDISSDITAKRTSKSFSAPLDAQAWDVEGWVSYIRSTSSAISVSLSILWGGNVFSDQDVSFTIPQNTEGSYFGGDVYFSGSFYFGPKFSGRVVRKRVGPAGKGSDFQVQVAASSANNFEITEVRLRFKASS